MNINIALHDGVVCGLMDTTRFHSQERGLEKSLGGTESLIANGDDLAIRKLIGFFQGGRGSSSSHFLFKIKGDIAKLFLELTDSQVQTENSMGKSITFIDGNSVGDTITRVHDNTSGTTRGIQGEDSLDGNIHGGHVESPKHD